MAALPYIQLYVAEYLADTQHLTLEEHGAYLLLIMNYWQRGKALVDSDKRMASVCSTDVERWLAIRSTIEEFFIIKDGFWVHNRIEKDLEKVHKKSKQAQEAGKKSAEKKKQNQGVLSGRSTSVDDSLQRGVNHTDTDTDTDTEQKKEEKRFTAVSFLLEAGAERQLAKDWLKVRKTKKLANTKTAFDGFLEEVSVSGKTINEVLTICCQAGWGGFKTEWLNKCQPKSDQHLPRLTGRQAYMVGVGNMLEELEDRKNGINTTPGTGILDAPCLSLPGGGTHRGDS